MTGGLGIPCFLLFAVVKVCEGLTVSVSTVVASAGSRILALGKRIEESI